VRSNDVSRGQPTRDLRGDGALVARIPEGEQQADRDRLGVELGEGAKVEWLDDAIRPHPLADAEAVLDRHERLGMVLAEPVEVRPVLAPQVQEVLEACRRDERRPRALPLQQRVGRDRRPVRESLELITADRGRCGQHRLFLALRGSHLGRPEIAVRDEHRVGEGAADIHAEDCHPSPDI
jgi:hypothetical protein